MSYSKISNFVYFSEELIYLQLPACLSVYFKDFYSTNIQTRQALLKFFFLLLFYVHFCIVIILYLTGKLLSKEREFNTSENSSKQNACHCIWLCFANDFRDYETSYLIFIFMLTMNSKKLQSIMINELLLLELSIGRNVCG